MKFDYKRNSRLLRLLLLKPDRHAENNSFHGIIL